MKRFTFTASPARLLDETGAGAYVCIAALFRKMKEHGWIKPTVNKRKIKLYDADRLDACIERLNAGEFPGE
jgi:hypothetical protein